ncbi:MAG: DUF4369 domain-containing protein [Bacteroidales bacterium]|jgi:hypothetical protein|nr:DUF4369 domain-containing protein [Bacteroidales bacterium]
MKKISLLVVALCFFFSCTNEKLFKISGTLTDFGNPNEPTILYLKTRTADDIVILVDSVLVDRDGKFAVKGKSSETDLYVLADRDNAIVIRIFVDKGSKISVTGSVTDFANIKVEGSKTHSLYNKYLKSLATIMEQQEQIREYYFNISYNTYLSDSELEEVQEELVAEFEKLGEEGNKITRDFIAANPRSLVAAFLVYANMYKLENSSEIEAQLQLLDTNANNKYITLVKQHINMLKETEDTE